MELHKVTEGYNYTHKYRVTQATWNYTGLQKATYGYTKKLHMGYTRLTLGYTEVH